MNGVSAHDAVNYDGYPAWWVWMLEHGLDGLVGAVLAVGGVAATLWWDRRRRAEEKDAMRQAEAEHVVRRIMEKALEANSLHTPESLLAVEHEVKLSEPVLWRIPELGASLLKHGALAGYVARRGNNDDYMVAFSIAQRCSTWLRDPETYTNERHDKAEVRANGATVADSILHPVVDEPDF